MMCKSRKRVVEATNGYNERVETPQGAYEGETVRLGTLQTAQGVQQKPFGMCGVQGGFPWWTLWLIWPLFGLVKGAVVAFGATATAVFASIPTLSFSISLFWPAALIVVGLVVLVRSR
jgi:hypothetical protein